MQSKTILIVAIVFGLLGAFTVGFASGLQNPDFTENQLNYITGVATGGRLVERFKNSEEGHANIIEECFKRYYPDYLLELSGCRDVADAAEWKI